MSRRVETAAVVGDEMAEIVDHPQSSDQNLAVRQLVIDDDDVDDRLTLTVGSTTFLTEEKLPGADVRAFDLDEQRSDVTGHDDVDTFVILGERAEFDLMEPGRGIGIVGQPGAEDIDESAFVDRDVLGGVSGFPDDRS